MGERKVASDEASQERGVRVRQRMRTEMWEHSGVKEIEYGLLKHVSTGCNCVKSRGGGSVKI